VRVDGGMRILEPPRLLKCLSLSSMAEMTVSSTTLSSHNFRT
jgi:hypothetical protein